MHLIADRFVGRAGDWIDLASGRRVALAVLPASQVPNQVAWVEQCAMASRLRHPALNHLIDYGAIDASTLFEAWQVREPLAVAGASASTLILHAVRFLAAHGIRPTRDDAVRMFREVRIEAQATRVKPVGWVLHARGECAALQDVLAAPPHGGVTALTIAGERGAGLRTLSQWAAKLAREAGYVVMAPQVPGRWPEVAQAVADRHVCLIDGPPAASAEAGARFCVRSALRSARSHVWFTFSRAPSSAGAVVRLAPLGVTVMTSMIYRDTDCGPTSEDLFDAARGADGLPARFLTALGCREGRAAAETPPLLVHESALPYPSTPESPALAPAKRRLGAAVFEAGDRAAALAAAGRHAHAARLLARAARVLRGRHEPAAAARCWRQLAWMSRTRGATDDAIVHAREAAEADETTRGQVAAAIVIAACWVDQGRLVEAEASLRSVRLAAEATSDTALEAAARLGLARALSAGRDAAEAIALVTPLLESADPTVQCEAAIRCARAHLAAGNSRDAIAAARAATDAADTADGRLRSAARRVLSDALCAAGDLPGARVAARVAMRAAAEARRPVDTLRARAALLRAEPTGPSADRLRTALGRALQRRLPPRVRAELSAACDLARGGVAFDHSQGAAVISPVEHFLDLAQRAADDRSAVLAVLGALVEMTGAASVALLAADARVISAVGRPWRDKPVAGAQALVSGLAVPASDRPPLEAGEPIRCGEELIGAIALRWILGANPIAAVVSRGMRAAAAVLATHARSLVEVVSVPAAGVAWGDLIGDSAGADALRESVQRASRAPFPVLIEGESGSGKELVARAVHRLSPRHMRRFCAINCAALSDELLEAELFGHTRGAFTGAMTERAGLFEEADGGTLFLDEVGELSGRAQAKLLRVLQEHEVRRIGENLPRRVDVRVVAATNRCLVHEVTAGRFRADLRFRLDVLRIVVPPLRERVSDIPLLAQHFWRQACERVGSQATLGGDALAALSRYDWPGNVRELQNAIAWIAVHAPRRGRVSEAMLPSQVGTNAVATGSFEAAREDFERRYVRAALVRAGGHRQVAAQALGVSRQGLAKMLRRLGIEK